ncbi:MAG: Asp-tRNA(Asn)/Glu-tRNA(Gln) amidotransferase subunit GatC [Burkholderiales bacterium]|nr:Asp-tRNA(Asn)/Glu-tRNA(Gln) amidotransferase subunit GatC [Burkholderiales bacterium]
MPLSAEEIKRIARLARIEVTDSELDEVRVQLNNILAMIGQMQAAPTEGVEPMAHAQDVALRLREDVVTEPDRRELFQSIAPQVEAGLYLVPKVIE